MGTCIDDPILDNVQRFGNKILIDNKTASSKEIKEMLRKTSPKSYKMYSAGRGLSKAGTILISTGGGLLLGGATCIIAGFDDDDEVIIMGLISAFGVVEIVTSIPLLITGKALKKKGIRYFDQNCLSDEPFKIKNYYQLNLNINTNGLGLSLAF